MAPSGEGEAWYGTSYMLEREHLDLSSGHRHPQSTTAHRWSNYLSLRYTWAPGRQISFTTYLQPHLEWSAPALPLWVLDVPTQGVEIARVVVSLQEKTVESGMLEHVCKDLLPEPEAVVVPLAPGRPRQVA